MIPYGHQDISQDDIEEVIKVLRSDFLTQGPMVPLFEKKMVEYTGASYGVAVNSATSALHVACLALGLGQGDFLWTSANTFVASANCAKYCGAEVDFVDIDPNTWNISTSSLQQKLTQAKKENRLPKIVVSVHFAGQAPEQEKIWALSQEYGFRILEDASHAIGASRLGKRVGNCEWSDITVFSFHPVKIITTGEGGIALTNDEELAWHMNILRSHGITRDAERMTRAPMGPWHYEQIDLGMNYRMTDIHAALGISQLTRLENFVEKRNNLAKRYGRYLSELPLKLPVVMPENYSAFHLYVVRVNLEKINKSYSDIFNALLESGIGVNQHYRPVYLQPFYQSLGFKPGYLKESENHAKEAITLPLFPGMNENEQDTVIAALKNHLND